MLFIRKETPPRFGSYTAYKPLLRRDFLFRCAYCLIHEGHFGGLRNFHIDHFQPKGKFPDLTLKYANLYYSCSVCNTTKGEVWPSPKEVAAGYSFADPCAVDPYEMHFRLDDDRKLRPNTKTGQYTIGHLRLNRRQLVNHRHRQEDALAKCREVRQLLESSEIPESTARKLREQLNQIEKYYADPPVPYESEDLLPN